MKVYTLGNGIDFCYTMYNELETTVRIIKEGVEWFSNNFQEHETTKDNVFNLEEMTIDPTMPYSSWCLTRYNKSTVGGYWAECGYYGFRQNGWFVLIPTNKVTLVC